MENGEGQSCYEEQLRDVSGVAKDRIEELTIKNRKLQKTIEDFNGYLIQEKKKHKETSIMLDLIMQELFRLKELE